VWSFGVLLYELFAEWVPPQVGSFDTSILPDGIRQICDKSSCVLYLLRFFSILCGHLLGPRCLADSGADRPPMRAVLSELADYAEAQNQCQICFSTPDEGMSELMKLESCDVYSYFFRL
jgi:hypothetical protein